jgi:thiol:disulfide interchange protein
MTKTKEQKRMSFLSRLLFLCVCCSSIFLSHPALVAENVSPSAESSSLSSSDAPFEAHEPVRIELLNEEETIQAGRPFWIALRMNMENEWHSYWKNPGDSGMASAIVWKLPAGFQLGPTLWPTPKRFSLDSVVGFGYEKEVIFLTQITPPDSLDTSSVAKISVDLRWVVCSTSTCLPGDTQASISLPIKATPPQLNAESRDTFAKARDLMPKKHAAITAQKKQNLIQVFFDSENHSSEFTSVDFFPEYKKTIDYKKDMFLQRTKENPATYTFILEEPVTSDIKYTSLKGVLVFSSANSPSKSYDVDVPIKEIDVRDEMVGIADVNLQQTNPEFSSLGSPDSSFDFEGGIGFALLLAFVGGFILNLMPCVLPVISFKILGFIKMARESRTLIFKHGLSFSCGVLISFWCLAGALLVLQAYGRSVGWGFQLQEPLFVAILASILLLFALNLFGLFEIGTSLMSLAGQADKDKSKGELFGSFLSGILATAVATPCTGPFLGSAIGFAVTLPAPLALLIFTSLGLGMSLPYLFLAAFPKMLRLLPRPGPWMVTFKELMGFFMLATVLWLVWVFGAETNSLALFLLLAGFFLLALGGWVYGKWAMPHRKRTTRSIGLVIALASFLCGSFVIFQSTSSTVAMIGDKTSHSQMATVEIGDVWENYSPERLAQLREQGIPVFIDFTAKWCLICQANHLVLSVDEVKHKFAELGVVKMKADWTKNDPTITDELRKFGRNGVPLYLLYGMKSECPPTILPQVLTPEIVLDTLKNLEKACE